MKIKKSHELSASKISKEKKVEKSGDKNCFLKRFHFCGEFVIKIRITQTEEHERRVKKCHSQIVGELKIQLVFFLLLLFNFEETNLVFFSVAVFKGFPTELNFDF